MRLNRTKQCAKCPWKVSADPYDIPNGYDVEKHKALAGTIAEPADVSAINACSIRAMACHETHDDPCLGWLMHQLGPGNNLALRLQMMKCKNISDVELDGEQHDRFEDTIKGES